MPKPLEQLMQKDMTRQEFMLTLGFGMASIFGFSSLIHLLTGKRLTHHGISQTGYGSTTYGGGGEAAISKRSTKA